MRAQLLIMIGIAAGGGNVVAQASKNPAAPDEPEFPLRFEGPRVPVPARGKLVDLAIHLRERLASEDFGLQPAEITSQSMRVRIPKEDEPTCAPFGYTAGAGAYTFYAPTSDSFLDGVPGGFDPVTTFVDRAVELGWGQDLKTFWMVPHAVREALNRYYTERLLEELASDAAAKGVEAGAFWPGKARARAGSLENLGAGHPLVADRDRILELLRQAEARHGRGELAKILNHCNSITATGEKTYATLIEFLKPVLPEGTTDLFPPPAITTREPWDPANIPIQRARGVKGQLAAGSYAMRLTYGEQRTTPRDFMSVRKGHPTLLIRIPPVGGMWTCNGFEMLARRTGAPAPAGDGPARKFWAVVMNTGLRELHRWPFEQARIPQDQAAWVEFKFPPQPWATREFFFLALEFEDPGEGADVEICVRPKAEAEHAFYSVPGRSLTPLETAVDFAIKVEVGGRGIANKNSSEAIIELERAVRVEPRKPK